MTEETLKIIISKLEEIISDKKYRDKKVLSFSTEIMKNDEKDFNGDYKYNEFVNDLAYDMDYYSSDERLQKEYGYFGDDKLEQMINDALIKLKQG